MIYPPPLGLIFLAYQFGSISKAEFEHMIKLWQEKHKPEPQGEIDER